MQTLDKSYFSGFYRLVNTQAYAAAQGADALPVALDAREARWNGDDGRISLGREAIRILKQSGTCLVQFDPEPGYEHVFAWQQSTFGPYVFDSAISSRPFSEIVATQEGRYFANTHLGQPMHSDDAHTTDAPRLISLYCAKQSGQGGVSTLVDLHAWLQATGERIAPACFAGDALRIQGARGAADRPLLVRDGNEILCAFPSILGEVAAEPDVLALYRQVMEWAHQPANQMRFRLQEGQLLLIDNYKVLHGRTGFALEDPRLLLRACFSGQALRAA
jgi:hypothetical protein